MATTVVVIDDDEDDLDLLKEALREMDPSLLCITISHPEDAIKAIDDELMVLPDYIFLDINMPKMTGDDCLKLLRSHPDLNNTSITILSTGLSSPVAKRMIALGANHAFQKPESHAGLMKILNIVFKT